MLFYYYLRLTSAHTVFCGHKCCPTLCVALTGASLSATPHFPGQHFSHTKTPKDFSAKEILLPNSGIGPLLFIYREPQKWQCPAQNGQGSGFLYINLGIEQRQQAVFPLFMSFWCGAAALCPQGFPIGKGNIQKPALGTRGAQPAFIVAGPPGNMLLVAQFA